MNWYKMNKKKEVRIGVIGYSAQKFDKAKASEFINEAFDEIENENTNAEFSVVSGLSDMGIPAIAYKEANKRKWETVGIAPKVVEDYDLYPCDKKHIIGKDWGEESNFFLDYIDVLVKIGGGKQSNQESKKAKEKGIVVKNYELESQD